MGGGGEERVDAPAVGGFYPAGRRRAPIGKSLLDYAGGRARTHTFARARTHIHTRTHTRQAEIDTVLGDRMPTFEDVRALEEVRRTAHAINHKIINVL